MDLRISGKVALVTGASRGIGAGICSVLAREGASVIACARSQPDLESMLDVLPGAGAHESFVVDFMEHGSVGRLAMQLEARKLSPDIIVNNVGGNLGVIDPMSSAAEMRLVFHINLDVAVELNRLLIPAMQNRKWGRICHISSISALENQGPPAYCAAKAALNAYVRSLGRYVARDNVVLSTVMPGAILTAGGYWDNASRERPEHVSSYLRDRMAIGRFGDVSEISELVGFMCSDLASFCIGSAILADGGQGRAFYPSDL